MAAAAAIVATRCAKCFKIQGITDICEHLTTETELTVVSDEGFHCPCSSVVGAVVNPLGQALAGGEHQHPRHLQHQHQVRGSITSSVCRWLRAKSW
eukprot:3695884-Amphidinium_carterae.2